MKAISKVRLIAELETHADVLTGHIALAERLGEQKLVVLFARDLTATRAFLATLRAGMKPKRAKTKTPCAWAKQIRTFFAVAIERGLDTRNDEAMRRAFENFLVRAVASREALDGHDWATVTAGVDSGELSW